MARKSASFSIKQLIFGMAGLVALAYWAAPAQADISSTYRKSVFRLTAPSNPNAGGTGFAVVAPSGATYTLSNAHVCDGAENGIMSADIAEGRRVRIKVMEQSTDTDLCILEAVPGVTGIPLGDGVSNYSAIRVLGHPSLNPLTLSTGYSLFEMDIPLADFETPKEKCVGKNKAYMTFETMFGPQNACIHTIRALATNVQVSPGNSGSPVFDKDDELAAVVFAYDRNTQWAYAIGLDEVKAFLQPY